MTKRRALSLLLTGPFVVVACSGGGGGFFGDAGVEGGTSQVSSRTEQRNQGCPASPKELVGTKKKGESCTTYKDCTPTCCGCTNDPGVDFLAAACVDGVCADRSSTCGRTETALVCANAPSGDGGIVADGGKKDGATGFDSGTPDTGGGGLLCTSGSSTYCTGTGMTWTGTQCCVSNATQCVAGSSSYCSGSSMKYTGTECCLLVNAVCTSGSSSYCSGTGMYYTGSQCCVAGASACTTGTSSYCTGSYMKYTGSECCVTTPAICVDGTSTYCYGTGMYYTGTKCCVAGTPTCTSGTSSSCVGTGKHWTGTLCCID